MEEKIGQSGTAEKKSGKKKWLIVAAVIVIAALAVVLIFALNGSGRDDGVPMGKSSVAETANGEIVTPVGTLTFPRPVFRKILRQRRQGRSSSFRAFCRHRRCWLPARQRTG